MKKKPKSRALSLRLNAKQFSYLTALADLSEAPIQVVIAVILAQQVLVHQVRARQ